MIFLLFSLVACLLIFAFFSAAESSFNRIGDYEIAQIKGKASPELKKVLLKWAENSAVFRYSIAVAMLFSISSAVGLIVTLGQSLSHPDHLYRWSGLSVALFFLLGHVFPKAFARKFPALVFGPALLVASFILFLGRPLALLLSSQNSQRRLEDQTESRSEDRLEFMLAEGRLSGSMGDVKKEILEGAFEIEETKVREIMTPRLDMVAIHSDTSIPEIKKILVSSGHSRLPVYSADLDDITGIVLAKDIMRLDVEGRSSFSSAKDVLRGVTFAPESRSIAEVLKDLKRARSHLAVIVDEYGGTSGIVTMEDILEEIVGEIEDEHDLEEVGIVAIGEGVFEVNGVVNIDEFLEFFHLDILALPEDLQPEDVDTLAGWVTQLTQEIPEKGQSVEIGGLLIEITEADRRRIVKTKVTVVSAKEPDKAIEVKYITG
jgi:CBS domain containing-hemolysin-like protein